MICARTRLSLAALVAIAAAAPALAGPAYLKFGGVKGESADDRHKDQIEILSWSWGEGRANDRLRNAGPSNGAAISDPQQSGEWIADVERPAERTTSDPQEGGEIARTKPTVSEIPVVKLSDKSSSNLVTSDPQEGGEVAGKLPGLRKPSDVTLKRGTMGSEAAARDAASGLATGKRVHKPMTMTQGSVTVTMPEGVCVAGAHYPAVTLSSGEEAYEMQDVTVASCTPVTTAKGKKDKAKLDYMVVTMETVLISG